MLRMVNFTTANFYNLHENTLKFATLKIHNPKRNKSTSTSCYSGFLSGTEIDIDVYQLSFECDIKIGYKSAK